MANEEDECLLVESSLSMNAAMVSIGGSGSYGEWSRVGGGLELNQKRERERGRPDIFVLHFSQMMCFYF